jgi:hypothetical protein
MKRLQIQTEQRTNLSFKPKISEISKQIAQEKNGDLSVEDRLL